MKRLVTYFIHPPIPVRDHDWMCHVEGEEESRRYGYGATEAEAIQDWRDTYDDD